MEGGIDSSRSLWFSVRMLLHVVSSYEAQLNLCFLTLQPSISIHSQLRYAVRFPFLAETDAVLYLPYVRYERVEPTPGWGC